MGGILDEIEKRFERLTVLEFAYSRNKKAYWKCLCDCGNIKIVCGNKLRSGHTKSCGCYKREKVSEISRIDLINQKFGRLLVLEFAYTKNGRAYWECLCDCDATKTVSGKLLRNGTTKSCGCLNKEKISEANKIDITGQRFGRWLVLEEVGRNRRGAVLWKCRCDCSTIKIVEGVSLRSGKSRSCGCIGIEKISERNRVNLIGQRFGKLLVLEEAGKNKQGVMWKCLCGCGNTVIVLTGSLRSGNTKSCGCYKRERTIETHTGRTDMAGEDNPNWNPNLTDEERQIRREYPEYKEWRKAVYEKDNYTCQCCGKRGGKLVAHHLNGYDNFPELRILLENGVTLCEECHDNFHCQYGKGNNTREQFEEFLSAQKKNRWR